MFQEAEREKTRIEEDKRKEQVCPATDDNQIPQRQRQRQRQRRIKED